MNPSEPAAAHAHAEQENRAYLHFVEGMDRVHRAIEGTNDPEQGIGDVLDVVLAVFECDRAVLGRFSGEPEVTSIAITARRDRPGFESPLPAATEFPLDEDLRALTRIIRATGGPVQLTPSSDPPLLPKLVDRFGVRSVLVTAVHPKHDERGHLQFFALGQRSPPRVWTGEELRLFQEIGRRLRDALTTVAVLRDLRRSEARFRTFVDHATDAFFLYDGQYLDVNRQACESLGYSREELIGMHPRDLDAGLDDASIQRLAERVAAGETVTFESVHRRKDGSVFPVEIRARGFQQGDRQVRLALVRDITERKRAEQGLLELQERFRALAESSLLGIYLIQENLFRYVNPALAKMFGYSVEELVDRLGAVDLVHPGDRALVAENMRRRLEAEVDEIRYELRGLRKDGSLFPIEVHGRRIELGGRVGVMGTLLDNTDRRRAEHELRRSQTYLAEAQRLSHTGSFGARLSRGEVSWSDETYRIFALDRGTPPTVERILQRTHPDDRAAVQEAIRLAQLESRDFDLEHRLLMPDGSVKHLRIVARVVMDGDGQPELVGAVMDVTVQKRAEEERRAHLHFLESMDRVNRAMQRTDDLKQTLGDVLDALLGIFDCDRALIGFHTGQPEARSSTFLAIRGRGGFAGELVPGVEYPVDEALRVIPRATRAAYGPVQFTLESDPPIPPPMVERFGTRSILTMPVRPMLDEPDRTYHFSVGQCSYARVWTPEEMRLFHEIGRRLGDALTTLFTLDNLQQSESRFRTLADFTMDPIMLHRDDGTIVDVNRQACESLGYGREDLIGMHPDQFALDREAAATKRTVERLDAVGVDAFECRYRRKDGTVFPVEVRVRQLTWEGNRRFAISLSRDITDRRLAEQERERLRQAEADLARVTRVTMMGELTASLAHEIKQPIAAAITNASACMRWLARTPPNLTEARANAARLVKDATRASEIINRVRSLYKKDTPLREPVDVNDLIRETIGLLKNEASRFSVSMHSDLSPELPWVVGDRIQLQQVLMNLILNGIEAMKDMPGALTVDSRPAPPGALQITVSDEGVGLPDGKADAVFEAFFTTKPHGTGMGLTISRSIVEAHGGRLWVTPGAERGACFHVTLPDARASSGDRRVVPSSPSLDSSGTPAVIP